jgi:chromosome segregation ATPase
MALRIKLIIATVIVAVVGTIVAGGLWYFNYSQSQIKQLAADLSEAQLANKQTRAALSSVQNQLQANQTQVLDLNRRMQETSVATNDLRRLFSEHNLTKLALEKPGLIETRINAASNNTINTINSTTNWLRTDADSSSNN